MNPFWLKRIHYLLKHLEVNKRVLGHVIVYWMILSVLIPSPTGGQKKVEERCHSFIYWMHIHHFLPLVPTLASCSCRGNVILSIPLVMRYTEVVHCQCLRYIFNSNVVFIIRSSFFTFFFLVLRCGTSSPSSIMFNFFVVWNEFSVSCLTYL